VYFVSGGGGRSLYKFRKSPFDEVGISDHHFMVVEVAGDRLFFEAITHGQKVLDCGVTYRTSDAATAKVDDQTRRWLAACDAARARPVTTQE